MKLKNTLLFLGICIEDNSDIELPWPDFPGYNMDIFSLFLGKKVSHTRGLKGAGELLGTLRACTILFQA